MRLLFVSLSVPLLFMLAGYQSETDRLNETYGAAAEQKRAVVRQALDVAADLPQPSNAYEEWVAAKDKRRNLELVHGSDEVDEEVRANAKDWIAEADKFIAERYQEIAVALDGPVVFRECPGQNAATLLIASDGSEAMSDRNRYDAAWYADLSPPSSLEELKQNYQRIAGLEYLLVLREADVALPTLKSTDDEYNEFSMGAMECDAFLIDLANLEVLHSFRFLAPNQHSVMSFGGFDSLLPEDSDEAVDLLTTRLYGAAHDFGPAVLAEMSERVQARHKILRDLLGLRLEFVDEASDHDDVP